MTSIFAHFTQLTAIKLNISNGYTKKELLRVVYQAIVICRYIFQIVYTNIIPKLILQKNNPTHDHD